MGAGAGYMSWPTDRFNSIKVVNYEWWIDKVTCRECLPFIVHNFNILWIGMKLAILLDWFRS